MYILKLYGKLAEDYGHEIKLEANSPREAVTALGFQCPKYKEYVLNHTWYVVLGEGKENGLGEDELDLNFGTDQVIHLIPAIEGAGSSNAWMGIIGGALFVVGLLLVATPFGAPLMGAGIGLMAGALVGHLLKEPKPEDNSAAGRPSFLFGGAVNTSKQGVVIPRGYGRMLVGSNIVSVALEAVDTE